MERAIRADDSPLSVVDSFAGRSFIHGGTQHAPSI